LFDSETGPVVAVAFDHGTEGAVRGGEDVPRMLRVISESRADAILLTAGAARHFKTPGSAAGQDIIAGLDIPVFGTRIGAGGSLVTTRQPWSPADARAAGASMSKMLLPLGLEQVSEWADAVDRIARTGAACAQMDMPLMVEPAFWGPDHNLTDQAILDAARLCVELGATALKVPNPADPVTLTRLNQWSPIPVLVLGGTPRDGGDFLAEVVSWMDAGAAGVVVGRNVWNRADPVAAIDALSLAVHEGDLQRAHARMKEAGTPLYSPALHYDEG